MARASTTYPSWQTTRACIIASIASLNLSSGTALAASRSSIMLRTCMSRAAHPRVKAPPLAAAAPATALRQSAASVHRANRCNSVLGMGDLLDYLGCGRVCRWLLVGVGQRPEGSAGRRAEDPQLRPRLGGSHAGGSRTARAGAHH